MLNTIEQMNKLITEAGIKADTPLSEAYSIFTAAVAQKLVISDKIIAFLKDIQGTPYECPHCLSHTVIERGNCHICDSEIAMPSTAIPQKAEKITPPANDKVETATTAEPKEKKTRTSKKAKEAAASVVESQAALAKVEEKTIEAKPSQPVTIGKYDTNLPSLQSGLKQAQDKENTKHAGLVQLSKDFNLQVPKAEVTGAKVLREQVIAEFERLIKACPPAPEKTKKAPKTVVVDQKKLEDEIKFNDEDLEFDDDETTTVETTSEDDELEDLPPKAETKKTGKAPKKKPVEKEVVIEDEDDAAASDDEDFTLDDDDLAVDDAEVEDIVLEDDDETDIED